MSCSARPRNLNCVVLVFWVCLDGVLGALAVGGIRLGRV